MQRREGPLSTPSGQRERVEIPSEIGDASANPAGQFVLHHNHPDSGSLSGQDVAVVLSGVGRAGAYAHGHDGTTYGARPGPLGHRTNFRVLEMATCTTGGRQLERQTQKGKLWPAEATAYRRHAINHALARAGVIDYSVSWPSSASADWNQLKDAFETAIEAGTDMIRGHLKDA